MGVFRGMVPSMSASTSRRELQHQRAELKALTDEISGYKSDIGRAM